MNNPIARAATAAFITFMTMSSAKPFPLQTRAAVMGHTSQVAAKTGRISAKLGSSLRPYASEAVDDVKFDDAITRERLEFIQALESIKADVACLVLDIGV